ncbi:hypothetical protein V1525DRAFT_341351 [Lipomyces kononenkoae]|uniref:Uncharacterized protein n=1 Tax=Lipomyces kononenkoae TaxID=34357 RepID=A0ACC3T3P7_LIPKO
MPTGPTTGSAAQVANGRGKTPVPIWGFNGSIQQQQLQQQSSNMTGRSNASLSSYLSANSTSSSQLAAGLDMSEFPTLGQANKSYSAAMGGGSQQITGIPQGGYSRASTQSPLSMAPRTMPPGLGQQQQQQQQLFLQQQRQQAMGLIPQQHDDHDDKDWPDDFHLSRDQHQTDDNHSVDEKQRRQEYGNARQGQSDIWQLNNVAHSYGSENGVNVKDTEEKNVKGSDSVQGLNGLLNVTRMDNSFDINDLTSLGLNLNQPDNEPLSLTFASPWAEMSTTKVEPEFHLPSCYHVQSAPPQQNKVANFSDETLFYIFYSMPRDFMQEAAAAELVSRNWRYHKELKVWLTKEPGSEPLQPSPHYERGIYTFFDPATWERVKKEYVLYYQAIA